MQSDVSVLTRGHQNNNSVTSPFMRSFKKEPNFLQSSNGESSQDVKKSLEDSNGNGLSSSTIEPGPRLLDSVDTLLRSRHPSGASNPDADLSDVLQFVSERSVDNDEKPSRTPDTFWLRSTSPAAPAVEIKHEEPLEPYTLLMKLPTVDQIMPFFPRSPTPTPPHQAFPPSAEIAPSVDLTQDFDTTPPPPSAPPTRTSSSLIINVEPSVSLARNAL